MPTTVLGENAITIPSGTTAQRPSDTQGLIRYNTTNGLIEYNSFGFWITNQNAYTRIDGKTKVFFEYETRVNSTTSTETRGDLTWTVPTGITYIFVKMWGAGGGGGQYGGWRNGGHGGGGGYSEGILSVSGGQVVTMRVGEGGWNAPGSSTAWPNGGGSSTAAGDNQYCANGGGSTSIRVPNLNSNNWCMFAGAGGGGGSCTNFAVNSGGAGGGLTGESGKLSYNFTVIGTVGKGGTQTAGGDGGSGVNTNGGSGSANQGGTHQHPYVYGGGGGGGYFGGGSGAYTTITNVGSSMGGGGGGSGYIHSGVLRGSTIGGSGETPAMVDDPDRSSKVNDQGIGRGAYEGARGGHGLIVIYY